MKKKALLISCFDWYDDRLKYIEEYLNLKGYMVEVLVSDFNHREKMYMKKYKSIEDIKYIHVHPYKKNVSVKRLLSHRGFATKACKIIKDERPNFVYCLVPPNLLVKKIAKLKEKIGYQLVFDVIDLWPESFPSGNKNILPFVWWKKYRDNSLNSADKVILECEYYKKSLSTVAQEKFEVLRLIKEPLEDQYEYEPFEEDICLCYLGSINSLIDIEEICKVIDMVHVSSSVLVRVVGEGEQREKFIFSLEAAGAKVKYYGKIYDEKKLQYILGNCHLGINIYKQNVRIGLTLKSVSYFQIGIPILNSIPGDTQFFVDKYRIGINISDLCGAIIEEYILDIDKHKEEVKEFFYRYFSKKNMEQIMDSFLI